MDKAITMYCENSRAVSQYKEPKNHKKGKHIEKKYYLIRDFIQKEEIVVEQIPSQNNLANAFTKPLVEKAFKRHLDALSVKLFN